MESGEHQSSLFQLGPFPLVAYSPTLGKMLDFVHLPPDPYPTLAIPSCPHTVIHSWCDRTFEMTSISRYGELCTSTYSSGIGEKLRESRESSFWLLHLHSNAVRPAGPHASIPSFRLSTRRDWHVLEMTSPINLIDGHWTAVPT